MDEKSNTHSTVHVAHNFGSPSFSIGLKETCNQKKKNSPMSYYAFCKSSDHSKSYPKWLHQKMTEFVPPFEMRISHPQCNCSDQLKTFISFLHCVGSFQLTFCLAHFQMSNHKCSLTLSASRHHIHPFMVDSKSEKGSKPSPLPKCFVWKLELSAKAPGTL